MALFFDAQGRCERLRVTEQPPPRPLRPEDPRVRHAVHCLEAWAQDPAAVTKLPRAPAATPFQARLREALLALKPGQTVSYGALARRLATSPRAIGVGCRANPLPLLVPCHRVVAARGPGGYAGVAGGGPAGFKAWLLAREQEAVAGGGPSP